MRIIGIDPGERWTGIGVLTIKEKSRYADVCVVDGASDMYRCVDVLDQILLQAPNEETTVVCEEYQVRPVGHQRFTKALTARVIGALEWSVSRMDKVSWETVLPADPDRQLELLGLSNLFENWRVEWPEFGNKTWRHGMSAWQVIGKFLLTDEPELLQQIRMLRVGKGKGAFSNALKQGVLGPYTYAAEDGHGDFIAPTAMLGGMIVS